MLAVPTSPLTLIACLQSSHKPSQALILILDSGDLVLEAADSRQFFASFFDDQGLGCNRKQSWLIKIVVMVCWDNFRGLFNDQGLGCNREQSWLIQIIFMIAGTIASWLQPLAVMVNSEARLT
jgi:hypothetical protein